MMDYGGLVGRRFKKMNVGVIDDDVGRELAIEFGRRKNREGVFVDHGSLNREMVLFPLHIGSLESNSLD